MVDTASARRNMLLRFMFGSLLANKRRLAGYLSAGTLLYASSIGLIATSVYLISRASLRPPILTLGVLIAGTRYFALSRSVSRYFERLISHSVVLGSLSRLRIAVFRSLVPSFPQEASQLSSGEMLDKVSSSMDDVQNLFIRLVGPLVLLAATAVLVLLFGLAIQPQAGVAIFLAMAIFAVAGVAALGGGGLQAARQEHSARIEFEKDGADLLRANEELFLCGTLGTGLARLAELTAKVEDHDRKRLERAADYGGIAALAAQVTFVATCYLSVRAIGQHQMPALLIAVMPMVAQAAFESVQSVVVGTAACPWHLRSMEALPFDPAAEPGAVTAPSGQALEIRFSEVVLVRSAVATVGPLSLRIPAGSKCAIVGESGSGKTSVAYAMLGYIRPASGDISRIAQSGATGASPADIGYLPENPVVLESSLRSNLAVACPIADDARLADSLNKVSLDYLLQRPGGLDQLLGGYGTQLSGGERQRLGLARLILAGFGTIILDEPTASLDHDTSIRVMDAVLELSNAKTVIVITHDRTLLGPFDQVIEV